MADNWEDDAATAPAGRDEALRNQLKRINLSEKTLKMFEADEVDLQLLLDLDAESLAEVEFQDAGRLVGALLKNGRAGSTRRTRARRRPTPRRAELDKAEDGRRSLPRARTWVVAGVGEAAARVLDDRLEDVSSSSDSPSSFSGGSFPEETHLTPAGVSTR